MKTLSIVITPEQHAALTALLTPDHRNVSDVVRAALGEYAQCRNQAWPAGPMSQREACQIAAKTPRKSRK